MGDDFVMLLTEDCIEKLLAIKKSIDDNQALEHHEKRTVLIGAVIQAIIRESLAYCPDSEVGRIEFLNNIKLACQTFTEQLVHCFGLMFEDRDVN